jgi:hypothetical protein
LIFGEQQLVAHVDELAGVRILWVFCIDPDGLEHVDTDQRLLVLVDHQLEVLAEFFAAPCLGIGHRVDTCAWLKSKLYLGEVRELRGGEVNKFLDHCLLGLVVVHLESKRLGLVVFDNSGKDFSVVLCELHELHFLVLFKVVKRVAENFERIFGLPNFI